MKPLKVALSPDLRSRLESAAAGHDRSVGEEVRARTEQSFILEKLDAQTLVLMLWIGRLALLTETQTGHAWHEHAGAYQVFRHAVALLLGRHKTAGDPMFEFDPADLPEDRPVAVTALQEMAAGLEAIVSLDRALDAGEQLELLERAAAIRQAAKRPMKPLETLVREQRSRAGTTGLTRPRKPKKEQDK
jgi:hypothetical protein